MLWIKKSKNRGVAQMPAKKFLIEKLEDRSMLSGGPITTGIYGPIPGPTNTGPSNPALLVNHVGNVTLGTPNAVVKNMKVTGGTLIVTASHVTIQNLYVDAGGNPFCIQVMPGVVGTVIQHGELLNASVAGTTGPNWVEQFMNIHAMTGDGALASGNSTLQTSWVHDVATNGIEIAAASTRVNVFGDNIIMPSTSNSCVFENGRGSTTYINGSWLDGGVYTINISGMNTMSVTSNYFGRTAGSGLIFGTANVWANNVYADDGSLATP